MSIPDTGGGVSLGAGDKISIETLCSALASYISSYESSLESSTTGITGATAGQVDQGTLLNIQAKVQTWGTIVSTAMGIVRAVGDGLKGTAQNLR